MNRVWDQSELKGSQLLLELAIADNANDDGFAWPGVNYLARKIRMSPRQVQRMIPELIGASEIAVEFGAGRGNTHQFWILTGLDSERIQEIKTDVRRRNDAAGYTEKGDKLSPLLPMKKATSGPIKDDKNGLKGDIAMSPEPLTLNLTNDILINTDNDSDPFYKFYKMALDQLALEFAHDRNDQRFIALMKNIYFDSYSENGNILYFKYAPEPDRDRFAARVWTTIGRKLWMIAGLEFQPSFDFCNNERVLNVE